MVTLRVSGLILWITVCGLTVILSAAQGSPSPQRNLSTTNKNPSPDTENSSLRKQNTGRRGGKGRGRGAGGRGKNKAALKKCRKLNEGLHALLDEVLIQGENDEYYNLNDKLIYEAACKIPEMKTLSDLALALHLPLNLVQKFSHRWNVASGSLNPAVNLRRYVRLMDELVDTARLCGFPHFPLNTTYRYARQFFQELIERFGDDFPSDLLPLNDDHLVLANVNHLALELVRSRNLDEFLIMTGLDSTPLADVIRKIALYADDKRHFRRDINRAIVLARILELQDNLSEIDI